MKHLSLSVVIVLAVSAAPFQTTRAAPQQGPLAATTAGNTETVTAPRTRKKMKMKKPIKMHEPMTTPMGKPGMMKEDMHEGMMQKDAEMKDMMEKEEQEMK